MEKMLARNENMRPYSWISYMMLMLLLGIYFVQAVPRSRDEGQKDGYPNATREMVLAKAIVKSVEEFVWKINLMPNGTLQITIITSNRVTINCKMVRLQLPELEAFGCLHWNTFGVCKANDMTFPQGDNIPPPYAKGSIQEKISQDQKLVKAKRSIEKGLTAKITKTRSISLAKLSGTPYKGSDEFNQFFTSSNFRIQEKHDEGRRETKEKISKELGSFLSIDRVGKSGGASTIQGKVGWPRWPGG